MYILGIETSTLYGTVALANQNKVLFEKQFCRSKGQSDKLLPACVEILKKGKVSLDQLKGIVVGLGPGSYTGLRVGLATAKGLSYLKKIPLIGVPSLDALVYRYAKKIDPSIQRVYAVIDARRLEHYIGSYDRNRIGFKRKGAIKIIANSELDKLKKRGEFVCGPDQNHFNPSAGAVALLGAQLLSKKRSKKELEPIYIRPFAAKKSESHKSACFTVHGQKSI